MPPAHLLLAWAIASAVLIAIPGPSVLFTIGRALSAGTRPALLTVVGNALGIYVQILLVAVGLGPVVAASAVARVALSVVGGGYLIWLGVSSWRGRWATADALSGAVPLARLGSRHVLRQGFVVGVTNAKTIVFFAAALPSFVDHRAGGVWAQMAVLGLVFITLGVLGDGAVALAASRARAWLSSSRARLATVVGVGGGFMMVLGLSVIVQGLLAAH